MKRRVVSISMTEEGYQALMDYMREAPAQRTLSQVVAELCSVGLEQATGRKVEMAGENWGGRRAGAGRKPEGGSPARKTRTEL